MEGVREKEEMVKSFISVLFWIKEEEIYSCWLKWEVDCWEDLGGELRLIETQGDSTTTKQQPVNKRQRI